jgi:hypothetical protein
MAAIADDLAHRPGSTADAADVATGRASRPSWTGPALVAIVLVGILLRAWRLGFNGLTYDESFTAMAARLPLDRMFDYLRTQDTHPPLDYLLRAPLARAGVSDAMLRVPSFVFSCGALLLFAWWMRARGVAGVVATAVLAGSSFQIYHGGEARMYALLELLGVASAVLAERWLRDDAPRWCAWAAGGLVAVALFDHVSGFLLVAGMLAVAGLRTDRRAWVWRSAVVAALALWAVVWGASFAHQASGNWVGWIPRTSPSSFAQAVAGQVTDVEPLAWVVLAAIVAGGWFLWRADLRLARVWLAVGVVPFVVAAAIGVVSPFLIDRAVTIASWAPPLALGYCAAALVDRWSLVGRALVVALVAVVAFGTVTFLAGKRYDSDLAVEHLEQVARPGDVIVTRPSRYATLPAYRIGVEQWRDTHWVATPGIDQASAFRAGGAAPTGRIWLFSPVSFELSFPGYRACARTSKVDLRPWTDGVTNIRCLERRS